MSESIEKRKGRGQKPNLTKKEANCGWTTKLFLEDLFSGSPR